MIDDFNSGIGLNKVGTEWSTSASNGSVAKFFSEREDALVSWGGSIRLEFSVSAGDTIRFFAPLEHLDASRGESVTLLVRGKEIDPVRGAVFIELRDQTGKKQAVEIAKYLGRSGKTVKPNWKEVVIPMSAFGSLDFNQLERFEILVRADKAIQGSLVLDEIGFFGVEDIVFESAKDNLAGFPDDAVSSNHAGVLLEITDDERFLMLIARDTWQYFENLIDRETGFPVDHIRVGTSTGIGSYTSPTNLALYWMATVSAHELGFISRDEAVRRIRGTLDAAKRMKRWGRGFWYNYYNTRSLDVTRRYISTVDNGWLAAAMVILRQAFPTEFGSDANAILNELDFSNFYDLANGQIRVGFDADKETFVPYHYGVLATEARLISLIAIGKGDLPKEHWARIYRTLPVEWDWQKQTPKGREETLFGIPLFEGHYEYLGRSFVPSWGGSLFEFLAPTLVVDEQNLAPKSLGRNNRVATELHIEYALREKQYPVWGISPCAISNGKGWLYREYGVPAMGAKGYRDDGVIAPYVSFLALEAKPEEALENVRQLLTHYPGLYGEYGFYDSVTVTSGEINHQYLALDQAMILLGITNFLQDGVLKRLFHQDPIGKQVGNWLTEEKFSIIDSS